MTTKLDRAKQKENYRDFMAIKDEEEALSFWLSRISSPVGKPYFTPMDYRWGAMTLRAELEESHARQWNSFWGLLHSAERQKSDEEFEASKSLLLSAVVTKTDYVQDWVESRYDNLGGYDSLGSSWLFPVAFSYTKEESPEDWEIDTNLIAIEKREAEMRYGVLYYWQEVKPAGEPANDGRRHCILVDRVTHQEAPLLPGKEPFPR